MHLIRVGRRLQEQTDALGEENRRRFASDQVYVLNLMSAPGSGKTSLLERTLERLSGRWRAGVVEGDIEGSADADRLRRFGCPVTQINTHGACHLDPRQVAQAIAAFDLSALDLLVIENVGNLVCPAEFDLGEADRVMLLSVTEGHDKPGKYPLMFRTADLLLLNKIDLLPATDFDVAEAVRVARALNPELEWLEVSCRTGAGLDAWAAWLEARLEHARQHWRGEAHDHAAGEAPTHGAGHTHTHAAEARHTPAADEGNRHAADGAPAPEPGRAPSPGRGRKG